MYSAASADSTGFRDFQAYLAGYRIIFHLKNSVLIQSVFRPQVYCGSVHAESKIYKTSLQLGL